MEKIPAVEPYWCQFPMLKGLRQLGHALCFSGTGNNLPWLNADGAGTGAANARETQAHADSWFSSGT